MTAQDGPRTPRMVMPEADFREYGYGDIAFKRTMTVAEAKRFYPIPNNLPLELRITLLVSAEGTVFFVSDIEIAAKWHAEEKGIEKVVSCH